MGRRSIVTAFTPCVVLAEAWPGWLSVLPSYGFRCCQLLVPDPSLSWIQILLRHHIDCQVDQLASPLPQLLASFVFGQGSGSVLASLRSVMGLHWFFSFDSSPQSVPGLTLSRSDYGGVMQGSWRFVSSEVLETPPLPAVEGRTLMHIVDSTLKVQQFTPCAAPMGVSPGRLVQWVETFREVRWADEQHTVLDGRGLLPATNIECTVRCPVIFSPTKWATRKLTVKEVLGVFDLSEALVPAFKKVDECPFLRSAPGRLLGAIVGSIKHAAEITTEWVPSSPRTVDFGEVPSGRAPAWPDRPGTEWKGTSESTTKSDDAQAQTLLWDERVYAASPPILARATAFTSKFGHSCLDALRSWMLRIWRRKVLLSLLSYLSGIQGREVERDRSVGRDALHKAAQATWWDWPGGSTPFFWRWPPYALQVIRVGHPPWFSSSPPSCFKPQRREKDDTVHSLMAAKLRAVQAKGYIDEGEVQSLTSYFAVRKGSDDIRMVYDATASGLNQCLWVPNFWLPSAEGLVETMTKDSWMGDLDMGEQFLNFPLHPKLQKYCGIDVRSLFHPRRKATYWLRWTRCMMGLRPSPYFTSQSTYFAEEVVQGNRAVAHNPFHWASVRLNLPGSEGYDPSLPWVSRLTSSGHMAGTFKRYVDDLRTVGSTEDACWQVGHRLSTYFAYLGLQVALRKLRPPSQHPGPWAGTIAFSCGAGVGITCPEGKWVKAQGLLASLQEELHAMPTVQQKPLESMRGFFIHLMRTYPIITPYLKGMHLTLDGWREHRDSDMWKIPLSEWEDDNITGPMDDQAPEDLLPAPRLADDVACLVQLFAPPVPPTRVIRCVTRLVAIYGFVDASTAGFGSSFELPNGTMFFRHGLWGRDANSASSNFRELCNLVDSIEDRVRCGELDNAELFIFTDNTTAEGCYYRGNSDSRWLFAQVLRLRKLEMHASLRLHVIHVAGTRMIHQGTDGLSRGLLTDGVFASDPMRLHVPLHLAAHDRCSALLPWIQAWCPLPSIQPLTPEAWFHEGHGLSGFVPGPAGTCFPTLHQDEWFLWCPPPAAARAALEELAISHHKRPFLNHIFIVPRLFTSMWRRLLYKTADVVFELPAGSRPAWPMSMHEPLVCGLTLRFAACSPYQLRSHPSVLELVQTLQGLWARVSSDERPILFQLCHAPAALESLSGGVAREVLCAASR
jgi:hypothetical protein